MNPRSTLFIYIGWQFFVGFSLAFMVITGLIILVDFVELSRSFGSRAGVGMFDTLGLTFLKAPKLIEETLPFVILFGAMNALFRLNRSSELITMRAAGLSAWKFLLPGVILSGLIGVIWTTTFNPIAVRSNAKFEHIRSTAGLTEDQITERSKSNLDDIWLREGNAFGQTVIYAKTANVDTRVLSNITFYQFVKDDANKVNFTTRYDAQNAQLTEQGYWKLTDVIETAQGRPQQPYEQLSTPTSMTWDDLREASGKATIPPFWQLPSEITKVEHAGFSARPLIIKYHLLLALPLTLIAMTIIAACVSMQMSRMGGALRLSIYGASIGFGVFFIRNMISAFGETGALPAIFSAWVIPLFILFCAMARLASIEDG